MRPRLLDLFCGAGGAAVGLHRAGFDVEGIDITPQHHYPFKFYQADALSFPLEGYDAFWASPPCQGFSITRYCARNEHKYPDLVSPIRKRLVPLGKPYIIENVPGCPLIAPVLLCGFMFDLPLIRHRLFECNRLLLTYPHQPCRQRRFVTVAGQGSKIRQRQDYTKWGEAMGIDWMSRRELTQAVPPSYSEFLGHQLIKYCERR